MARIDIPEQRSTLESYQRLGLEELRPLGLLVAPEPPTRKRDLVPLLADAMARDEVVRKLYEALDDAGRAAVQEATHDPVGRVDRERFRARYGRLPDFGTAKGPTPLRLFLPRDWQLPADLHAALRTFVTPPRAVGLAASDDLPESVPLKPPAWGRRGESRVEVPLRQRATAAVAGREVRGGPAADRGGQGPGQRQDAAADRRDRSTPSGPSSRAATSTARPTSPTTTATRPRTWPSGPSPGRRWFRRRGWPPWRGTRWG